MELQFQWCGLRCVCYFLLVSLLQKHQHYFLWKCPEAAALMLLQRASSCFLPRLWGTTAASCKLWPGFVLCSRLRLTLLEWFEINGKNLFKSNVLQVSIRNSTAKSSYPILLLCGKEYRTGEESAGLDFLAAVPSRRKLINQHDMGVIYCSSCLPEKTHHLVLVIKGRKVACYQPWGQKSAR